MSARTLARDYVTDAGTSAQGLRRVPVELPVAIEYNGIGYAVLMASPGDLDDFARGFTLTEALVRAPDEIRDVDIHPAGGGVVVRITLAAERLDPVLARARSRMSESACGLCGIETIEQALRDLPRVTARLQTSRAAIHRALDALRAHQPLGAETGAVHAAAFCTREGEIRMAREDVGRHNALDKLVGALAAAGISPETGFLLLSSRCSYELVEKAVRVNCPLLVTISAPTSLAVERACAAGLTLVALARSDSMLVLSDPHESIA